MGLLLLAILCTLAVGLNGDIKCESGAIDLVFVMDQSGSVGANDFQIALAAAAQLTNQLTIGDTTETSRVGFVLFDDLASVEFGLNDFKTNKDVENKIKNLPYTGESTDIALGMRTAVDQVFLSELDRGVPKVMILITDGEDNTNVGEVQKRAEAKQIKIYALGVGADVSVDELIAATGSLNNVYKVEQYSKLAEVMDKICREVFPSIAPPPPAVVHPPRSCECDYKKTWLDLVFLVDSSQAVSTQDFNGVRNFLASFARTIPVSQKIGAYSRIAIINVGSQAQKIADLTAFENSATAAVAFRGMTHLKDKTVNMFEGLKEATNIIDNANLANERKNVKKVIVIFTSNPISCAHYNQENKMKLKAVRTKVEEKDPCRIAAHLREAGNIVLTVGMKFDGIGRFPDVNVSSPCYSINYDTSMAAKFTQLMCKANCFCLPPYIQFKDDEQCLEYGECIYLQGTPLDFLSAKDTCSTYNTKLSDVHSIEKELFLQAEHTHVGYIPYWIGASKQNGVYTWETGTSISSTDYTDWAPSQPDESAGECIVEKNDKFKQAWYSADCSDFLSPNFFSCQKDACSTNNYCVFDKE